MNKKSLSVVMIIVILLSMITITPMSAYAAIAPPSLIGHSAWREDGESASINFMSSESGTYYYTISESNTAPSIGSLTTGTAISSDTSITFTPSGLTSGKKYVHIAVKNESNSISDYLSIPLLYDYCYYENFESYPLNTTVASNALAPISQIHSGNGSENQKVVAAVNSSSEKMLTLSSSSGNASDQVVILDKEILNNYSNYVFEGDVYPLGTDGWQLRFSFTNGNYEYANEAGVFFIDGKITTATRNSPVELKNSYTANQWHHVKIIVTPSSNTYAVYVDDILLNNSLPLPSGIDRLAITAGHGKTAHYDNLEFYVDNIEPYMPFGGGSGTSADPYLLLTKDHLNNVRNYLDSSFIQMADIDLSGVEWQPIGINYLKPFAGTFNGNGYKISDLTINSPNEYQGLFGYIRGATLNNINLDKLNIQSSGRYSGGLSGAASDYSRIQNCSTTGQIQSSGNRIGGLVGDMFGGASIYNSYSTASVTGRTEVGGLVGYMNGSGKNVTMTNCYSAGSAMATTGYSGGAIGHTYSSVSIDDIYWNSDKNTSAIGSDESRVASYTTSMASDDMKTSSFTDLLNISASELNETFSDVFLGWSIISTINDNYPTLSEFTYACEIGTQKYITLSQALSAAVDGNTIKLLMDVSHAGDINVTDKNLIFDLKEYTLNVLGKTSVKNGSMDLKGNGELNCYDLVYAYPGGSITVTNIIRAIGTPDLPEFGVSADGIGANVHVYGNVTAAMGVDITNGGSVTIDGIIDANKEIRLQGIEIDLSNVTLPTTKPGYLTYSDGLNTAWLAVSETPAADNISIEGDMFVGKTITGTYHYTGSYPEGNTSFRWLRISGTPSLLGEPFLLYTTNNIYGVTNDFNGPPNPTTFTVDDTSLITKISNYHYNSMDAPGTISLQNSDGTTYGPWDSVLNGYWCVYPNLTIPAGTYTVIDSKPNSWSFNPESGNSGMVEVAGYTIITDAVEKTYTLQENDYNKSIIFEVTPRDIFENAGVKALSIPFGPISMVTVNQPPALRTNWNYNTVYFGQNYPFTISITDEENSPNARLYSFIDNAEPSQAHVFQTVPGTVNVQLSPLEGVLSEGIHTLNYYAIDEDGATSPVLTLRFTVERKLSSNASLSNISLSAIDLIPSFDSAIFNYSASIGSNINSAVVTATPSNNSSTVIINETEGNSKEISLSEGINTINIDVIAEDQITTNTYKINISKETASSNSGGTFKPSISVTTKKSNKVTSNSATVSATISSDTAHASIRSAIVDALLEKARKTDGIFKGDIIETIVDVPENVNKLKISIPLLEFHRFKSETKASIGVNSPLISILFDEKAVETIAEASNKGNVVISAERLRDYNGRPAYDLRVTNNGVAVSDFNGGHATVTIPYMLQPGENPNAVVVYYLDDDGTLHKVLGHYNDNLKAVVLKTTHFSKFVISYNYVTFADIAEDAWYKNAVDFIAARSITTGTGNNNFSPETNVTRAQFVVLIMNSYQINVQNKEALSELKNFNDAGNTYYTEYLMAAKSLGIVNGVGNNLFAPEKEITRQEMCVMLYNALIMLEKEPASLTDKELSSFNDAGEVADWAEEALSALLKSNVISGHNNRLNPLSNTTRAEVAQVLYNLLLK